ncbi:MAG: nickel-dependent hydrogenase large subunit [Deltaproteobacteria bacterium]|nr:nickel-dependent hydrogenase large subunit [Deltaproteobacteria bacterium]
MAQKKTIRVPMHRVEGDLEIEVDLEGGIVSDARCSGVMYRGIENILIGRAALDCLVIAPRICGICSTAHLTAAAMALDMVAGVTPPPDAVRMRNVALMAEQIQNDVRHTFLIFAGDFANQAYKGSSFYAESVNRYEPFKGQAVLEVIKETKKVLELVAIIGGQWPHSSYMVPGGIVSLPSDSDLLQCKLLIKQFRSWYEKRILGCSVERWIENRNLADLDRWLTDSEEHSNSELGFLIRLARNVGLDKAGRGPNNFINFGGLDIPLGTRVRGAINQNRVSPAGFAKQGRIRQFDQALIKEHMAWSWYDDHEGDKHPSQGETKPYATGGERGKYSWSKAPRYDGYPAETGPLAEMIIAGNQLINDIVDQQGPSVLVRQLARLIRPTILLPALENWLTETSEAGKFYSSPGTITDGEGYGLTCASRGALGHWIRIKDELIEHYQVITPTTWNASPKDTDGVRGPIEEALVGASVRDVNNPVELGHIVRSFDPCLVCTVHVIQK